MKVTESTSERNKDNHHHVSSSPFCGPNSNGLAGTTLQSKLVHQGKVRRRRRVDSSGKSVFRNVLVNFNPNVLVRKASALDQCEQLIEDASPTIVEVCLAVVQIRKQKLFWPRYETIEAYFADCWHLQEEQVQHLLAAAEVVELLSPIGEIAVPCNDEEVERLIGFRSSPESRQRNVSAPARIASIVLPTGIDAPVPTLAEFIVLVETAVSTGQPKQEILRLLSSLRLRLRFCGMR
jgi:hypothetical protein